MTTSGKPSEIEVRAALWFVWSEIPPNVRRELDLPGEVVDICDRCWRDIEFAGSRLHDSEVTRNRT